MVTLLLGGVIALVVVFVILFSNASFTESSRSEGNKLTAAQVGLTLSKPGAIVDAANIRPGQSRSGDIQVTNTGNRAQLSVKPTGFADTSPLAKALRLKITPQGQPGTVISNSPLAPAQRIQLGTQTTGQTSAWTFELTLPSPPPPGLAGSSLNAAFDWEVRAPGGKRPAGSRPSCSSWRSSSRH